MTHSADYDARVEDALDLLADISERATGDGKLRDAIAVVRDTLWCELDEDTRVLPPG